MYDQLIQDLQEKYEMVEENDWIAKMELEGEIEDLKVRMGQILPPKPLETSFECVGCGS